VEFASDRRPLKRRPPPPSVSIPDYCSWLLRLAQRPLGRRRAAAHLLGRDRLAINSLKPKGSSALPGCRHCRPGCGKLRYEPVDLEPAYLPRIMVLDGEMFAYSANKIIAGVPHQRRTYQDFGADRIAEIIRDGTGAGISQQRYPYESLSICVIEPIDGRYNQGNRRNLLSD
jgi:hypothetical protein